MQLFAAFSILASFLFQNFHGSHAWSHQNKHQIRNKYSLAQDVPLNISSSLPACKRRQVLKQLVSTTTFALTQLTTSTASAAEVERVSSTSQINTNTGYSLQNYIYRDDWVGTSLPLLSPSQAVEWTSPSYSMGRWPDIILRRPASTIDVMNFGSDNMQSVAKKLRRTARDNGAVGLAAQQW